MILFEKSYRLIYLDIQKQGDYCNHIYDLFFPLVKINQKKCFRIKNNYSYLLLFYERAYRKYIENISAILSLQFFEFLSDARWSRNEFRHETTFKTHVD